MCREAVMGLGGDGRADVDFDRGRVEQGVMDEAAVDGVVDAGEFCFS